MKYRLVFLFAAFMILPGFYAFADSNGVTEVNWEDLVPKHLNFDDPFEKLTEQQLYNLASVAGYRQKQADKQAISESFQAEYEQAITELKKEGVDIDGLLAKREEITEKRRARALSTNAELNGKTIRMAGYLLPLEFKQKKVTEFLLVPWVGACIHTPPPPANQIVHVKLSKGFEADDNVFTPVWVNGTIKTESNNPELSYVDGRKNISVSYVMTAENVELYKK